MKEFLIGLLVLFVLHVIFGLGLLLYILLAPFLFMLGVALRILVFISAGLFIVWLIGKLTLLLIDALRGKEQGK